MNIFSNQQEQKEASVVGTDQQNPEDVKIVGSTDSTSDLTDKEIDDIDLYLGKDGSEMTRSSAKGEVLSEARGAMRSALNTAIDTEADIEQTASALQSAADKQAQYSQTSEFSYEESAALTDDQIGAAQFRYQSNFNIASSLLNGAFEDEQEASFWNFGDAALDFIDDLARGMTVGVKEAFEERLSADSMRIMYWAATLDAADFRTNFSALLDDYKNQGFIRDDNVWGLVRLQQALFNEGLDPDAGVKKFWAVVDVVDIIGITKGVSAGRKLLTSTSRIGRVAAHEGVEAAEEVARKGLRTVETEVQVDTVAPALRTTRQPVEVPNQNWTRIRTENDLVVRAENILEQSNRIFTGDEAAEAIDAWKTTQMQLLPKSKFRIDTAEIDYKNYDAPRFVGTVTQSNGKPFRAAKAGDGPGEFAIRAAQTLGGKVVPIDPSDATKGYVVKITTNVKFTDNVASIDEVDLNYKAFRMAERLAAKEVADKSGGLTKLATGTLAATDSVLNGIANTALFRKTASANARSASRNSQAIDLADRNLSVIKSRIIDPELKEFKKLSVSDRQVIDDIATDIRDGSLVESRDWISDTEFAFEYERRTGKKATEQVIENYNRIIDLWDTVAYIEAKNRLGRFIELDYKGVNVGDWSSAGRTFPASAIDKDSLVFHAYENRFVPRSALPKESVIFSTIDWFKKDGQKAAYVVAGRVEELGLKHVMGYNAGGSRLNPNANFFVGGILPDGSPSIYLSASTEKQAQRAILEVRTLQEAYRTRTLTDEVFNANKDHLGDRFNNAEEFMAWVEDDWPEFGRYEFQWKPRDSEFVWEGHEVHKRLFDGMSSAEFAQMSTSRSNRLLEHFGGSTTTQVSSLNVLEKSLGNSLQEMAFRSANLQAATGLVKALRKHMPHSLTGVTAPDGDVISQMFQAVIPNDTKLGRQLIEQRNIIMRRMGAKGTLTKSIDQVSELISQDITDVVGTVAKAMGKKEPQSVVDVDLNRFTGRILGANHTLAFVASPFQAALQGSHVAHIVAISPKSGMKGSMMALKMRGVLNSYTGRGERMVAAARLADFAGYTQKQMDELIDAAWKWGADVIDGENLENGMGHTYALSVNGRAPAQLQAAWEAAGKAGKTAKDVGMVPYNMGERFAQMTSFFTAADEFIKANPAKAVNSAEAMLSITERANALNFNMRRTSRSAIQQGPAAIPLQFLTYVMRAGEAVLIGRGLTGVERARLAAAMGLLYGATGLGLENKLDTPENPGEVLLKYGVMDAVLSIFGLDTAVAPRMSVLGGFKDVYRRITEDGFTDVLAGPTGGLAINATKMTFGALVNLISGNHYYTFTEDLVKVIRSASGGNNLVAAHGIYKYGVLTSRNGSSPFADLGFTPTEAILKLLGVTTLKETEFWNAKEEMWRTDKEIQAEIKNLSPKFESLAIRIRAAHMAGDYAELEALEGQLQELIIRLDFILPGMGYTTSQVKRIRNAVLNPDSPGFQALVDLQKRNGMQTNLETLDQ